MYQRMKYISYFSLTRMDKKEKSLCCQALLRGRSDRARTFRRKVKAFCDNALSESVSYFISFISENARKIRL